MERTAAKLNLYPIIVLLYSELYKQVTVKSSLHTYDPTTQSKVLICKFIDWLNKNYHQNQLGIDFLINYFEFQFNRYIGVNSSYGRNAVALNWLIGPKAIEVWKQRDPTRKKFIKYRISVTCKLHLERVFNNQKKVTVNNLRQQMLSGLNDVEELEKERYYNTKTGYLYCAGMTTLYNPKSEFCNCCLFKEECKERLKINYKNIFESRMKLNNL